MVDWIRTFQIDLVDKVVAIDGKTSRRSFDGENKPMHLVSAFVSELGITLGQLKTADKSNEITAIPELLEMLDLQHAVVTLDSMGCQTKIVDKIIEKEANFLIALKGNQGTLNEDVRLFFESKPKKTPFRTETEYDKGHGRLEMRQCTVSDDISWLKALHPRWQSLNSIIKIQSQRETKGNVAVEQRYYISSLPADASRVFKAVRQHWADRK